MPRANIKNTRKRCEICSRLTIKTPERNHNYIVNFDHISHLFLFLLLTFNKDKPYILVKEFTVSWVDYFWFALSFTYFSQMLQLYTSKKNQKILRFSIIRRYKNVTLGFFGLMKFETHLTVVIQKFPNQTTKIMFQVFHKIKINIMDLKDCLQISLTLSEFKRIN